MNQGRCLYWLLVQLAAVAVGVYLGLMVFDAVST